MRQFKLIFLSVVIYFHIFLLSSCIIPASSQRVSPIPTNDTLSGDTSRIDIPSFRKAEWIYGKYTIPCGEFLISKLASVLSAHSNVQVVSLLEFNSSCTHTRIFNPDTECNARMKTKITTRDGDVILETNSRTMHKHHYQPSAVIVGVPPETESIRKKAAAGAVGQVKDAIIQLTESFSRALQERNL
jgi:hypothetical protein